MLPYAPTALARDSVDTTPRPLGKGDVHVYITHFLVSLHTYMIGALEFCIYEQLVCPISLMAAATQYTQLLHAGCSISLGKNKQAAHFLSSRPDLFSFWAAKTMDAVGWLFDLLGIT